MGTRKRARPQRRGLYAVVAAVAGLAVATGIMLVVHKDHPVTARLTSCGAGSSPVATLVLHNASGSLKKAHVEVGFYDGLTQVATGSTDQSVDGMGEANVLITNAHLPSTFDLSHTLTCQITKKP